MKEDGKFRERAYERLYQLYEQLSRSLVNHSRNMILHGGELDIEEIKRRIEGFTDPKKYEYFGIISDSDLIEIKTLETTLFGKTFLP